MHRLYSAFSGFCVTLALGVGANAALFRGLGHNTEQLLEVAVDSRSAGYTRDELVAIDRLLLQRIGSLAGVRSVTRTSSRLMRGPGTKMRIPIEGLSLPSEHWDAMGVGPQFFETMGIPVVRGRTFTRAEFSPDLPDWRDRLPESATDEERRSRLRRSGPFIVNEAFAKKYAPNIDLVGSSSVIVGIVKDTKLFNVRDDVKPLMFVPSRRPDFLTAIQVRTTGAAGVEMAIRRAIEQVNPRLFVGITRLH
jgi:hypothetical protein